MAASSGIQHVHMRAGIDKYALFATNLINCLASEYGRFSLPRGNAYYCFRLSPLHSAIVTAARIIAQTRYGEFRITFLEFAQPGISRSPHPLLEHARQKVLMMRNNRSSIVEAFEMMVYIAMLSIMFYETGCAQAPHLAVQIIADTMFKYMKPNVSRRLEELYRACLNFNRNHQLYP